MAPVERNRQDVETGRDRGRRELGVRVEGEQRTRGGKIGQRDEHLDGIQVVRGVTDEQQVGTHGGERLDRLEPALALADHLDAGALPQEDPEPNPGVGVAIDDECLHDRLPFVTHRPVP